MNDKFQLSSHFDLLFFIQIKVLIKNKKNYSDQGGRVDQFLTVTENRELQGASYQENECSTKTRCITS